MADSPVLLWPYGEGTGTPKALVGTAPTGMYGGTSWVKDSLFGWIVADNGTGQVSREGVASPELPVGSTACTMEGWCFLNSVPGTLLAYGYLNGSSLGGPTNEHRILQVGANAFTDGVNGGNNKTWTTTTPTGRWCHVAMTYAGGAGGQAIFYLNGVADVTTTLSLNTTSGVERIRNGLRSDDGRGTTYLNGRMAFPAVYATALSPARIAAHYQAGLGMGVTY